MVSCSCLLIFIILWNMVLVAWYRALENMVRETSNPSMTEMKSSVDSEDILEATGVVMLLVTAEGTA